MISLFLACALCTATAFLSPSMDCAWKTNFTDNPQYITKDYVKQIGELENCLYYYLLQKEFEASHEYNALLAHPPPIDVSSDDLKKVAEASVLRVEIEDIVIHKVELKQQSSYQFRIEGDVYLNWMDKRLTWNQSEWHLEQFTLHDTHHIWSPKMKDFGRCADDPNACMNLMADVDLIADGHVYARMHFGYDATCNIDFSRFPEEENNCCIFFSGFEPEISLGFDLISEEKHEIHRTVRLAPPSTRRFVDSVYSMEEDHSAWTVDERKVNVVNVAPFVSLQMLRVCVHAQKKMATLSYALHLPILVMTFLMLASPFFGSLIIQIWTKLAILFAQMLGFFYLCSLAPSSGFMGQKPDIYSFFETLILFSTLSIAMTISMVALSRRKHVIPPRHRMYLASKLFNRFVCCIEPEQGIAYRRYVDESEQTTTTTTTTPPPSTSEFDYTQDWRHIYLAINNLFSASLFVLLALYVFVYSL